MPDTPLPPPSPSGAPSGGKGNFLTGTTAGLPNWGWILVIAGGMGVAWFFWSAQSSATNTSSTTTGTTGSTGATGTTGTSTANTTSGYDLSSVLSTLNGFQTMLAQNAAAITAANAKEQTDIAAVGTAQSSALAGITTAQTNLTNTLQAAISSLTNSIQAVSSNQQIEGDAMAKLVANYPIPLVNQPATSSSTSSTPSQVNANYVTVTAWPSLYGTLGGIASANGTTVARLLQLNPGITNADVINTGQQVRIS